MRKYGISVGLALAFGLFALAGCGAPRENAADPAENTPAADVQTDRFGEGPDASGSGSSGDSAQTDPEAGRYAALAVLDEVDVSAAFGDREAEGWSFALSAAGELNASYSFSLTSELSGEEKLNSRLGAGIGLEDLIGLRSAAGNASGVDLFGGGKASLSLFYRGPAEDSEPRTESFDVGFRHDGDLIWYAGKGEEDASVSLSSLKDKLGDAVPMETFERMQTAFEVIPEELGKGVSLRLAVEKLVDLGFAATVDDTDGITISVKANEGFYTDLLNDLLEEFLPAKWLSYLPRADLRYEKTCFDITLAFDENGLFREYSMKSDVSLTAALEVRGLFAAESGIRTGGSFSFTASRDAVPEES